MGAAKKLEMLPEETFIQEALTNGRAFKTELSLKAIGKPDYRFQARVETAPGVHLDLDHVARLERLLEEEGRLHPIVVFYNPRTKKYLIADGFHRFDAYRRARREAIPAYQLEGDERDALEYCTMCNRLAMKTRTKEDIRKGTEMLFSDEKWWNRSDHSIACHVGGCSSVTVRKWRASYAGEHGRPMPDVTIGSDGRRAPRCRIRDGMPRIYKVPAKGNTSAHWLVRAGEKHILSSTDKAKAEKAFETAKAEAEKQKAKRIGLGHLTAFSDWLSGRAMVARLFDQGVGNKHPGIYGLLFKGGVCLPCDFSEPNLLPTRCGQLIAARRYKGDPSARMVVVCYPEDGPAAVLDLYRAEGFEFLTPEELVESLKGECGE